jgi:hypothetical protein
MSVSLLLGSALVAAMALVALAVAHLSDRPARHTELDAVRDPRREYRLPV